MALNNPYALYFDGVDDYVRCTLSGGLAIREHTLEFFIKREAYPRYHSSVAFEIAAGTYLIQVRIYDNLGVRIHYYTHGGNFSAYTLLSTALTHLAFAHNGATTTIYINGVADRTVNINIGLQTYNTVTIGQSVIGSLDEIRFWDYCRSQSQIQADMYKKLRGTEEGLALYYRFDEGTGNIANDSSPNANHGTIYGASWVPGLVDLEAEESGRIDISAILHGSSSAIAKADRIRGLSVHLAGAATSTGGTPIRIRGLTANLQGAGTTKARMNLIAALKSRLRGAATLKANALVLYIPEGVYVIDADEIFSKDQPSRGQVVANHIEVWVNPLKPADTPEEVYRSKDPVTIPAGKTETVTIQFDDEPVTEPAVVLEEAGANLSIVNTKYYAWGADVTIKNAGSGAQTCRIVATGKPLKVQGREKIVKEDPVSIQENGLKKYTFDNPFVQDRATAELIADKLLSFANAKRDIIIEWRGDPALQLADIVMIPEYQRKGLDQRGIFYVTKQELEFDGGLRAKLEGRKM